MHQDMETTGIVIMAKIRVTQTHPETWMTSNLVPCRLPLALRQLSHSYTTTNLRQIGSRKWWVKFVLKSTNAIINILAGLDVGHRSTQTGDAEFNRTSPSTWKPPHGAYKRSIFPSQRTSEKRTPTIDTIYLSAWSFFNSASYPTKHWAKPSTKTIRFEASTRTTT